jgi:hypothetical protein
MDLALAARDTAANSVFDLSVARLHLIPTPTGAVAVGRPSALDSHWIAGALVDEQV